MDGFHAAVKAEKYKLPLHKLYRVVYTGMAAQNCAAIATFGTATSEKARRRASDDGKPHLRGRR